MSESGTEDLPPGPWSYMTVSAMNAKHPGNGHVYIQDANGRNIASIWGKGAEKIAIADLILRARNGSPR